MLEIRDNGMGFNQTTAAAPASLELVSMRRRVDNLGGTSEVTTVLEQGTIVRIRLELRNGDNGQSDPNLNL